MADDVAVSGANELAAVTKRLKEAGAVGLKRDMLRGLREGAKPLVEVARQSALDHLPKSGGLAAHVAETKIVVRTRTSGSNPGVRVVGVSGRHLKEMDQGRVRHPTFGHGPWVTQTITPGWWSKALTAAAPQVRAELVKVLDETARRIEHG